MEKAVEVLKFFPPRGQGVVTEFVLGGSIDVRQSGWLRHAVGTQKCFGIGAHRQAADPRISEENMHRSKIHVTSHQINQDR